MPRLLNKGDRLQRKAARALFYKAIRCGVIARRYICQRCGAQSVGHHKGIFAVQAHHPDYDHPLQVEWLCHPCHKKADAEVRARIRAERGVASTTPSLRAFWADAHRQLRRQPAAHVHALVPFSNLKQHAGWLVHG